MSEALGGTLPHAGRKKWRGDLFYITIRSDLTEPLLIMVQKSSTFTASNRSIRGITQFLIFEMSC